MIKNCVKYLENAVQLKDEKEYIYFLDTAVACLYHLEFKKCLKYFYEALKCLEYKENSYTEKYLISYNANIVKNVLSRSSIEKPKIEIKK